MARPADTVGSALDTHTARVRFGHDALWLPLALAAAALVGLALPYVLVRLSTGVTVLMAVGLVVMSLAAYVAFAAPKILIAIGFLILPVVRWEPAPVDVLFGLLMVTSLVTFYGRPRVPAAAAVPLVILTGLTLLSLVNAVDPSRGMYFEFITLYMVALGVWLTGVFRDETVVRLAMKAFIVGSVVSAACGLVATQLPGVPGFHIFLYDSLRAKALFKDPNVFGPYLVPAALFVLEDIVRPRLLGWRLVTKLVSLLLLLGGVLVAYSRAGWLNLAVGLAALVAVYAWRRNGFGAALKASVILILAVAAGFGVLVATGSLSFLEERSRYQSYDVVRFSNQSSAFNRMTEMVFGHGPGQADRELEISAHSLYVRLGFEQGALGFVLGIVLTLATLWCALVLVARDVDVGGIGSGALLGSWLGVAANGIFVDTLHWRHLWVVAALIWVGYWKTVSARSRDEEGSERLSAAPAPT